MAFKTNKILPCPEGHSGCVWENQGGWHRCYCPLCHSAAQKRKEEHKKWQRKARTHSVNARDVRAQHSPSLEGNSAASGATSAEPTPDSSQG